MHAAQLAALAATLAADDTVDEVWVSDTAANILSDLSGAGDLAAHHAGIVSVTPTDATLSVADATSLYNGLSGIAAFVEASNAGTRLNAMGRGMFPNEIRNALVNRLRFADELKRHPEILDEQIRTPLFILGLPRTGQFWKDILQSHPGTQARIERLRGFNLGEATVTRWHTRCASKSEFP